ncbi:MAG TPA: GNAT family N-acetyltransferase, partial [Chitinophagaceae bacterium]|nr:GNAT family N-acetyltransferase [Chitinophagaceae bacterium]
KIELLEYLEHTYDPVKLAGSLRKENNIYLLALVDGEAIGFAKLKLNSLNEQIESVAQVELQKIYVLHEFHGSGVGAALMKEIKWRVRDIYPDYIWLDTHISNEKAIQFYERNGFHKIGKYFFTIGTQVFEYHVMGLPVAFKVSKAC